MGEPDAETKWGQVMMSSIYPDTDLLGEPSLDEIFAEPIVRLIMQRDGVSDTDLRSEIDRVQQAYGMPETVQ